MVGSLETDRFEEHTVFILPCLAKRNPKSSMLNDGWLRRRHVEPHPLAASDQLHRGKSGMDRRFVHHTKNS